jgi:hypothetical protein
MAEYKEVHEQKKKRHSDNITPRNLNFDTTHPKPKNNHDWYVDKNGHEMMATLKDNLVLAKHLLGEYDDPEAVDKTRYILARSLDQQQKADTSRELASDPFACISSAKGQIQGTIIHGPDPRSAEGEKPETTRILFRHPPPRGTK